MCYYYEQLKKQMELEKSFLAEIPNLFSFDPNAEYNGFQHPFAPVILKENPSIITLAQWGLLPFFAKDIKAFRKRTPLLNAKIETVDEKPTFKHSTQNRCLVLASAIFEWKHFDGGKIKVKHRISLPSHEAFAMAGLYQSHEVDGEEIKTFTILTTEANTLMADIHNSKKRMPVILRKEEEQLWLEGEPMEIYHNRKEVELVAEPLGELPNLLF